MKLFITSLVLFCLIVGGVLVMNFGSLIWMTNKLSREQTHPMVADAIQEDLKKGSESDQKSIHYAFKKLVNEEKRVPANFSANITSKQDNLGNGQNQSVDIAVRYLQEMEQDPNNKVLLLQKGLGELSSLRESSAGKTMLLEKALKITDHKKELMEIAWREIREPFRNENSGLNFSDDDPVHDTHAVELEAEQNGERIAIYLAQSLLIENAPGKDVVLNATIEGISSQLRDKNLQQLMFHQFVTRFPEQKSELQEELRKISISLD